MSPYLSFYFFSGKSLFFTSPSYGQEKKIFYITYLEEKKLFLSVWNETFKRYCSINSKDMEIMVQKQFIFELVCL